jgi:hypothetical protein
MKKWFFITMLVSVTWTLSSCKKEKKEEIVPETKEMPGPYYFNGEIGGARHTIEYKSNGYNIFSTAIDHEKPFNMKFHMVGAGLRQDAGLDPIAADKRSINVNFCFMLPNSTPAADVQAIKDEIVISSEEITDVPILTDSTIAGVLVEYTDLTGALWSTIGTNAADSYFRITQSTKGSSTANMRYFFNVVVRKQDNSNKLLRISSSNMYIPVKYK